LIQHDPSAIFSRSQISIRESLGNEYPILVKINCSDFHEGGLSVDDSVATALLLEREGIDGVEISGGLLSSRRLGPVRPHINSMEKEAYFREEAARINKEIHIPLLLVGGIRSFETAESLLEQGVCDFVSMCRPFICEPGIAGRWKSGDTTKSRCNSDNLCFRPILGGDGVRCVTFSQQ
jgi:2,4-dienoyl-CoA reductase-like NADH-dependent reductase (Old Yellow Enzyme family)